MKDISLYQELFTEVEGKVQFINQDTDRSKYFNPRLKYETRVPQLETMCMIMEKIVLKKELTEAKVFVGFQKFSRTGSIWERFLEMARQGTQVYVFGLADQDIQGHENITKIALPKNHHLIQEWFLVIDSNKVSTMMVARDMDGFDQHEDLRLRKFKGIKCNNKTVVKKAKKLLEQLI